MDKVELRNCTFERISGIADTQTDEYPSYAELQDDVMFLFQIYERELRGDLQLEYEWKKVWRYEWGKITLIQEMQNSRAITDIIVDPRFETVTPG